MTSKRLIPSIIFISAALALALSTSAEAGLPAGDIRAVAPVKVQARPHSVELACPSSTLDSFDTQRQAPASVWVSNAPQAHTPGQDIIAATAPEGESLEVPSALSVLGQGGGELAGLSTIGCQVPALEQWVVIGATTLGSDAVLRLINPTATPSTVRIDGYGATGPLGDAGQSILVPARSSVDVLPAGFYPDEQRLALRISADGAGVAAFAQISALDGEVPQGAAWITSTVPQKVQMILGVAPEVRSTLLLAVPGEDAAEVSIALLTSSGEQRLDGADLSVDAGTVLAVPLTGAVKDLAAVRVEGDRPILASIYQSWDGAAWPGNASKHRGLINMLTPTAQLSSATWPSLDILTEIVDEQLGATPLRDTSVTTAAGSGKLQASILITHADAADSTPAHVTVGSQNLTIDAGTSRSVEIGADVTSMNSDVPVRAALILSVETPAGTMRAAWPLGASGLDGRESAVYLRP